MTEAALIAAVQLGDAGAERALYDAHVDRVWRLVYRLVGDADHAADCVQDTFVKAFAKLADFRGESALGTWIGAIAISIALNKLRTLKREASRHQPIEAAELIGVTPRHADPDLKQRLTEAIASLPDGYRTVFVMHDMEGYTHEEIAATIGVQTGTSKAQLFRARAKLRTMLAAFAT